MCLVEAHDFKPTFNSIEWILHHHGSCSVWKVLSFPLHGFYSIEPPGGGSMYVVLGRVFKLYAFISYQISRV
jgi:hypothetical protein